MSALGDLRALLVGEIRFLERASDRDTNQLTSQIAGLAGGEPARVPRNRRRLATGLLSRRGRRPTRLAVRVARILLGPSHSERRRELFRNVFSVEKDRVVKVAEQAISHHYALLVEVSQGGVVGVSAPAYADWRDAVERLLWFVPPQNPESKQVDLSQCSSQKAHEAHARSLFPQDIPEDPNFVDLVVRIDSGLSRGLSKTEIAREFFGEQLGSDDRTQKMLKRIRRAEGDGRVVFRCPSKRTKRTREL